MAKRPFFKGLGWLLVLNAAVKPLWIFGIDRQVQNLVGGEVYGTYFSHLALTYVLLFIADAGLTNLAAQQLASGTVNAKALLRLKALLLVLYAVACVTVGALSGIRRWDWLLYLIAVQALGSLFLFLRSLLTANQHFTTDALFSVLDKALLIALCAGPVYGFFRPVTINLFLQLQVAATAVALLSLAAVVVKKGLWVNKGESRSVAEWLRRTVPFAAVILLMAAHYRLDGFLLERLHPRGAEEAGVYAAAFRLLDAGNTLGYLCASFLVPFVARNATAGQTVNNVVLLTRHGLLLLGVTAVAFAAVYGGWVQQILYRTDAPYNTEVLRLCLAVLPAYYLTHVYGAVLTATGNLRPFVRILLLSVLVNVALNVWWMPFLGAKGCCLAAMVSQWGCALALWLTASKRLRIPLGSRSMFGYGAAGFAAYLAFAFCRNTANPVWVILAAIVLFLAIAALCRQRIKNHTSLTNS